MSKQNDQPIEKYDSIISLFVRVFWSLIGNVIAFFVLVAILRHKGKIFYTADIIFWGVVAALILARYLDIKFWPSTTEKGTPVTMAHWRKYTILLLICSTLIWVLSHAINCFFVNK